MLRTILLATAFSVPVATIAGVGANVAHAEDASVIAKRLTEFENQARQLADNLPKPEQASATTKVESRPKRLIEAQLLFRNGMFADAALALFEIVGSGKGAEYDPALYYLAEALYQKGDRLGARNYFTQLVDELGGSSKYQAQALQRLIEIAIELGATEATEQHLLAVARTPAGNYITGKWQFAKGQYDDALRSFADVSREGPNGMQAMYFTGACHVAKKDLQKATEAFLDVTKRKPKSAIDRRVLEMSQLALGRVFYEREQPSKSVDWYLAIDRRSDLFADALFEAAWVYVKSKQFDKALAALELLSAQDPFSQKTPTVKILEGNLRVRKAQILRNALLSGLEADGDPGDEYLRAEALFQTTKQEYGPAFTEIRRVLDERVDLGLFLGQIGGRDIELTGAGGQLPEIAASWVRDESSVSQVVAIESELGEMHRDIVSSEKSIARLEALLAVPHGANAYPLLAERRNRANEMIEANIAMRSDIATQLRAVVQVTAEVEGATSTRQAIAAKLAALPNAAVAYSDRLGKAQEEFDNLEKALAEIDVAVVETEAGTSSLRVFARQLRAQALPAVVPPPTPAAPAGSGSGSAAPPAPATEPAPVPATVDQATASEVAVAEMDPELVALKAELAAIRSDILLGRDLAGTGDEYAIEAATLREQMKAAQDNELRVLAAANPTDSSKAKRLLAVADQSGRVATMLQDDVAKINAEVERGLVGVKQQLAVEKTELAELRAEFTAFEAESRTVATGLLATGFQAVREKLYDIVVRSDVGNVDVNWSRKEDIDADVRRFQLERTREVKQIRDEFRDVIDAVAPPITNPAPASSSTPATPAPTSGANQ